MKKRIISASRRTDIPAFYSEWFMNRLRAGFCMYPNPMYPKTVYRVDLTPEALLGMIFWTRNAMPMLKHIPELEQLGCPFYFQYTIVNNPRSIDPHSPPVEQAVSTFRKLSSLVGPERIVWRYDPIILDDSEMTADRHLGNFRDISTQLAGLTDTVVLSIIDPYAKTKRRMAKEKVEFEPESYIDLLTQLVTMAAAAGLRVQTCAEPLVNIEGLTHGACVDADRLTRIAGRQVAAKKHNQRKGCGCHQSVDIGVNNTCAFGCKYCYATSSPDKAAAHMHAHDVKWNSIAGELTL